MSLDTPTPITRRMREEVTKVEGKIQSRMLFEQTVQERQTALRKRKEAAQKMLQEWGDELQLVEDADADLDTEVEQYESKLVGLHIFTGDEI